MRNWELSSHSHCCFKNVLLKMINCFIKNDKFCEQIRVYHHVSTTFRKWIDFANDDMNMISHEIES